MEIVFLPRLVHLGSIRHPQAHTHVIHPKADKRQVEIATAREASPA